MSTEVAGRAEIPPTRLYLEAVNATPAEAHKPECAWARSDGRRDCNCGAVFETFARLAAPAA